MVLDAARLSSSLKPIEGAKSIFSYPFYVLFCCFPQTLCWSLTDGALLSGKEWAIRSDMDSGFSVAGKLMYTIHHEADAALSGRRHLEGAARPIAAAPYFHFGTSASGCAGSLRKLSR
jgi:hypothetical protein